MKIALDATPILNSTKTGIGFFAEGITRALLQQKGNNAVCMNYFAARNTKAKLEKLASFVQAGAETNPCFVLDDKLYKLFASVIPVPYHFLFGKAADISHFFNFIIPPGVSGKKVVTIHDMSMYAFPETVRMRTRIMLRLGLKRSCRRADKIVTISQFSKEEIMRYLEVPEEKIVVVPCAVDHEMFAPPVDLSAIETVKAEYGIQGEYLLYLGTLEPRKNIKRMIEAYADIRNRSCARISPLILAGGKGWMYEEIFHSVKNLKMEDHIRFIGYVKDKDVPLLIGGAQAFLFPSLYEGFGMPVLEAMSCGTPVLTSAVSSLPEVAGDSALLVDPYDIQAIGEGMERLIADASLREDLRKRGLQRAAQFSWQKSAKILLNVYKEMLGKTHE